MLPPEFSSQQGSFRVLECLPEVDRATATDPEAALPPIEFRFQHRGPGGETSGTYAIDADSYSAIVDRLQPQFWDGHLVTLESRAERGGLWLIGNWTGSGFVVTLYPYATGDEDGLEVKWDRDAFIVTTVPEGERRVTAHDRGGDAEPGYFMTESTTCTTAGDATVTHKLRLGLDTDGRVIELEYTSAVPVGDGTNAVCLIQAGNGDFASDWARAGNGDTTVDIAGEDDSVPDSQLRIHRNEAGDTYTVDFDVVASSFCGNSDAIARQVVLKRDTEACVAVRMHEAQAFDPPAGFDCNQATQPIERTICGDARMRWLDGSLAQAYRGALEAATDAGARETLRAQQRHWVAERDRLYGPRKLFVPDVPPEAQLFEDYMRQGYANRISELRDLAHGPIWSRGPVRLLADDALLSTRGDLDFFRADGIYAGVLMEAYGRAAPRSQFSPDGRLLAVVIQGRDREVHDQVWWYRIDDELLLPATPIGTILSLAWDGPHTLLVRMAAGNGQPPRVFATTGDGYRELGDSPARVRTLLDAAQVGATPVLAHGAAPARCDDCDLLALHVGDAHAPWLENRSGTVSLKAEGAGVDAPPRLLAWGSWEVLNVLYDPRSRQVVFADETGIVHGDLAGNVLRRIAASRPGDVPLAFDPAHGLLAWRTRGGCDVDQSDPDRPRWTQLCIAQFPFAPAAVAD